MEIIIKCGAVNVRSFFPYLGSFSSSFQAPSFLKSFPSLSLSHVTVDLQLFSLQRLRSRQVVKHLLQRVGCTVRESGFSGVGNPVKVHRGLIPPESIKHLTLATHDTLGLAILRFIFRAIASLGSSKNYSPRSLQNPSKTSQHVRLFLKSDIYFTIVLVLAGWRLNQIERSCLFLHFITSIKSKMSRSHHRPSDYSRGSSPRIDRNLSVTEASFQNLGLNETAGAQYQAGPSSYLLPDQRSRRPSYPRSGLSSGYLQPDYVSSSYTRAASPASFSALENSTSFGTTLLDPSDYQLFSETGTFSSRASPFSTSALGRTDMG